MKKSLLFFAIVLLSVAGVNAQVQTIADTSFEVTGGGGSDWQDTSTSFGTVLCQLSTCGNCGGQCVARTGNFYVWFGGITTTELGWVRQTFNVASAGIGELNFWLKIPNAGNAADSIVAQIDGNQVWFKLGNDTVGFENAYRKVEVNLGNLSIGNHTLTFRSRSGTGVSYNALVDDVSLVVGGTAGVTDYDFESGITVFVNNLEHTLNFAFDFNKTSDVAVHVTDLSGRTILAKQLYGMRNDYVTMNTSGWASGLYNITLSKPNAVITKKMYIQN